MTKKEYKKGDLRIWWNPQIGSGCPSFYWDVENINEAKLLMDCLAQYDLFQYHNKVKPDYCNAGGLNIYDEDPDDNKLDWFDWLDDDGFDIDQHFENLKENVED